MCLGREQVVAYFWHPRRRQICHMPAVLPRSLIVPVHARALALRRVVRPPLLHLPLHHRVPLWQPVAHVLQPLAVEYVVVGAKLRRQRAQVFAQIVAGAGHNARGQHEHAEGRARVLVHVEGVTVSQRSSGVGYMCVWHLLHS
jgi:hypothetical protein